jgi:hypothetical protein
VVGERLTPEDLVDLEEIKRVKYAYLRCLDTKDWDGLAATLAPEATAAYSGGRYTCTSRDEIVDFVRRNMGREAFHSSHRAHHPEIELDGDRAQGTWALEDVVIDTEWGFLLLGAAFYTDDYVRTPDGWRIARTAYRRTFETIVPTSSLEGFAVTASWWATDGRSSLPAQ